jgi:hypothetical protein
MVLERINDKRVSVLPYAGEVLAGSSGWDPSPVADVESPYFLRLSRLAREVFPGALTAPFLVIGGTDSRHYASVTDNAFRFSPVVLDRASVQSVHAVNERLSFENCAKMVCFYTAYIQEMATLPGELDAGGSVADADDEDVQELIVDSMAWEDDEDIPIPTLEETMAFGEEDEADIEDNGDDSSAEEPA